MSRVLNGKSVLTEQQLAPAVADSALVQQRKQKQQATQEWYFNRSAKELPPLQPGDTVVYKKDLTDQTWQPGTVVEPATNPRSYVVQDSDTGATYLRNRRFLRKPARYRE